MALKNLFSSVKGVALDIAWQFSADAREFDREHIHPIDAQIKELAAKITKAMQDRQSNFDTAKLFERDFKSELNRFHAEKEAAYNRLDKLKEELSELYDELHEIKSDLDSWYAKSNRSFFGNKGRELPRHSFFSQSIGDRDSLKSDRDDCGERIGALRSERTDLQENIRHAKEKIASIHRDKRRLAGLRKDGMTADIFYKRASGLTNEINRDEVTVTQLKNKRIEKRKLRKRPRTA